MASFGFSKVIRVRLTEQDYARAIAHANNNPERYKTLSHLARAALIFKINTDNNHEFQEKQ